MRIPSALLVVIHYFEVVKLRYGALRGSTPGERSRTASPGVVVQEGLGKSLCHDGAPRCAY